MVESKVVAQSGTAILTGITTWALVTYVPAWHQGLPPDLAQALPLLVAWVLASAAGYLAPHTHRPDLVKAPQAPARRVEVPPSGAVTVKPPRGGTMPGN